MDIHSRPIVCMVTDRHKFAGVDRSEGELLTDVVNQARRAGRANVDLIQVREEALADSVLFDLVKRIISAVSGFRTRVIVNDRIDVAVATGAAGVHLKENSVSAMRVRSVVPKEWIIGRSVHDVEEAKRVCEAGGLDYLLFGTVFRTESKPGQEPNGVGMLSMVCEAVELPVIAIGGVAVSNVRDIAGAGATGVAGMSLFGSRTPDSAQSDLLVTVGSIREAFLR